MSWEQNRSRKVVNEIKEKSQDNVKNFRLIFLSLDFQWASSRKEEKNIVAN